MKNILILLFAASALFAETKTEADLKKQLEAAQAALSAERQRVAALSAGTQKLSEAVAVNSETAKEAGKKIEQVAAKSESDKAAIVQTVKTEAAATQSATRGLATALTNQVSAVGEAVFVQGRRQQAALADVRDVARKLEIATAARAEAEEAKRVADEKNAAIIQAVNAKVAKLTQDAEIAAARDEKGLREQRYKLYEALVPVLLGLVVLMQMRASGQAKATHTMVNGEREKREKYVKELEEKLGIDNTQKGGTT